MNVDAAETFLISRGTISHVKGRAAVSLLALLCACSAKPPEPPVNASIVEHEIVLSEGDSVLLGQQVSVTFVRVAEDSRCPAGVTCVWEGNARVVVRISGTGDSLLNTNATSGALALQSGAVRIALAAVEPEPQQPNQPPPAYRIRLRWGFLPD